MKIRNKQKKMSIFLLISFIMQIFQGLSLGTIAYAEEITKNIEVTKQEMLTENEVNTISLKIKVKNLNAEEINLSDLSLDYWYDNQGIKTEEIVKDWCSVDQNKVNITIEKLDKTFKNANSKINIVFGEGLNTLKKNEEIELNVRLQNKENLNYIQDKNHSYVNGITVNYKGNLVEGQLPEEIVEEVITTVDAKMYNKQVETELASIYPWFKVLNTGNTELDLSKLEVRYYYTADMGEVERNEEVIIDWSNIGKEKIVSKIIEVEDLEDADRYLSLKVNSNEKLAVENELEIHSRVNKEEWELYNQENDYSFNAIDEDYVSWNKIVVLYESDKKALLDNVHRLGGHSGGTNISAGVDSAIQQLKNSKDRNKKIILLTDGEGTFHNSSLEQAKNNNIKIYTIGLGTSYNKTLLEQIANETGGKYYHVKTGDEIDDITDDIHGEAGSGDMDGDGIPDKDDENKYEFNINNDDFVKQDQTFMQAANLSYERTDNEIGSEIKELNLGSKFNLLNQWEIIESDDSTPIESTYYDSGFGAIALKHGENIIIAFEGSGFPLGPELLPDWIETDLGAIGLGLNSKQVYFAYKFVHKVMSSEAMTSSTNIYISGHSLGGWLAQKIGGSLLNGDINLTKKSSYGREYYKNNQIPFGFKGKVENFYNESFKRNEGQIKKIATFAAPGFTGGTRIYDNHAQKSKIVYNYKMNEDWINQFGIKSQLLGRNKWMISGIGSPFKAHSIDSYYENFNRFFSSSTFEKNE